MAGGNVRVGLAIGKVDDKAAAEAGDTPSSITRSSEAASKPRVGQEHRQKRATKPLVKKYERS